MAHLPVDVAQSDALNAVDWLRCQRSGNEDGLAEVAERVDPVQLNLVLAGLLLGLLEATAADPESYLEHLASAARANFPGEAA